MEKTKSNIYFVLSIASFALFFISLLLTILVDKANVGLDNTPIGMSHLNTSIASKLPYNDTCYKISNVIGYLSFIVVGIFGLMGFIQLLKRKSFIKVDLKILILGALYIILGLLYVFFEIIEINYRPIDLGGGLEASFPSSHTMLVVVVFGSLYFMIDRFINNKKMTTIIKVLSIIIIVTMIITRLLSGIHWFTDILSGIFLSSALVLLFNAFLIKYTN